MQWRNFVLKAVYFLRDVSSRYMFKRVSEIVTGNVLDVGGGEFFFDKAQKVCRFQHWTVVDPVPPEKEIVRDKFTFLKGDGTQLPFSDNQFDVVLNIQVLEHTFNPERVFSEIVRVLKPEGKALFLVPQTSNLHMAPHHYYNFTQYWVRAVTTLNSVRLIELKPIGGFWYSMASRLFYFNLQAFRYGGMYNKEFVRSLRFYLVLPLMLLIANLLIPVFMFLSLFDSPDEANNLFFIIQKNGIQN
jgi:SAM-dependent methyltransferase